MLPSSAAYKIARRQTYHRISRFTSRTPDGTLLAQDIPIGGGSVKAQLASRVTRTATFTASDEWFPVSETDPLSPTHAIVTIESGLEYPTGEQEFFPVFTGRVYEVNRGRDGEVTFRADDLAAEVLAADFEQPVNSQPGASCVAEVQRLILDGWSQATFGSNDVEDAVVPALSWDEDRGKACDDLAEVVEARWFTLGNGDFVVRRYAYTDLAPVITLFDGPSGDLTSAVTRVTADGAYNSVVVISERVDGGDPIRVVERNLNALSPYRYDGPFGKRVRKIRSQASLTVSEAQRVARSQLAAASALTRQWDIAMIPDVTLEPGDVIGVEWRDVADTQVIDSIVYPLSPTTPMTLDTRSSISVESVA